MKLNPEVTQHQHERLNALRTQRDNERVASILAQITQASENVDNLFPIVLEAVRASATLGEIMQAMKVVFGTYSAPSGF
jgi:methylmalonyl-CoA mutase N-terminal domain/subunit